MWHELEPGQAEVFDCGVRGDEQKESEKGRPFTALLRPDPFRSLLPTGGEGHTHQYEQTKYTCTGEFQAEDCKTGMSEEKPGGDTATTIQFY
jgi:hypothetical protein